PSDNNLSIPLTETLEATNSSSSTAKTTGSSQLSSESTPALPTIDTIFVPPAPPPPALPSPPVPNPPAAPVITTIIPVQTNAASTSIAGTAEANSTVTLSNNGSPVGTTTADGTGHWSVNNIALTDGANYSFTATTTDAANNTSGPSNALAFHDSQNAPAAPLITTTAPAQYNAASIST